MPGICVYLTMYIARFHRIGTAAPSSQASSERPPRPGPAFSRTRRRHEPGGGSTDTLRTRPSGKAAPAVVEAGVYAHS